MRLLVSVSSAAEASAARAGGADIIDAKDPHVGALGAVSAAAFEAICAMVPGTVVSAALGDAVDEASVARTAGVFAGAGAALVKVGFAGISDAARIRALLHAAKRGAGQAGVIAVAYADHTRIASAAPGTVLDAAADAETSGVLLDTAIKDGPGLCALMDARQLGAWVEKARRRGLLVALAGRLSMADLDAVAASGADIAGVRGAACAGGRTGQVTAGRVRALKAYVGACDAADSIAASRSI